MTPRGRSAWHRRARRLAAALALALGPWGPEVGAQVRFPSEDRTELPEIEPQATEPGLELPPLPAPRAEERTLATARELRVRGYRFVGNSAFGDDELAELLAPYTNRSISNADIPHIRDVVTRHYIEAGYVNSGAVIPDQQVRDGIIELQIVEGRLERIGIAGNRYFRASVLRNRIERSAGAPLRVSDLERQVRLLQEDPRIRQVHAELHPGSAPGRAVLEVRVQEFRPYAATLETNNHEPTSVGAEGGGLRLAHQNLLGFGDALRIDGYGTAGLWETNLRYEIPVTRWGTTLGGHAFLSGSEVVTSPFDRVDVESKSQTYGWSLRQPLYRVPGTELSMSLIGEWRQNQSFLLGRRRSFEPGPDRGRSRVAVLRLRHDLLHRDGSQVLALRSQLTGGLDALRATSNRGRRSVDDLGGDVPDGRFVAWLAQLQWARRYAWGIETLLRADLQLSNDPLLSMERLPVGGANSVRGYRENQLVRDQGFVSSFEVRIPCWRDERSGRYLQLAPFVDFGYAWNESRRTPHPRTLSSAGIGVRAGLTRWIRGELYWGHAIRDVARVGPADLQDSGIHFRLSMELAGPRSLWNDIAGE